MIKVTIELDTHGKGEKVRTIGVIVIANDATGDDTFGNYEYALSHAGKYIHQKKGVYKKGRILRFKRTLSPYRLLQRVLKDAGEI